MIDALDLAAEIEATRQQLEAASRAVSRLREKLRVLESYTGKKPGDAA